MTDTTLLGMLNAARALHERSPHDLSNCATCHTGEWPCPTATALGATGRSEWTTPTRPKVTRGTRNTVTDGYPHMLAEDRCGAIRDPHPYFNNIGGPEAYPCTKPANHRDTHTDTEGDQW